MNKLVTELALYDVANVAGIAADISHCNTPVKVQRGRGGTVCGGASSQHPTLPLARPEPPRH